MLLFTHPHFDVLKVDWQDSTSLGSASWVLVELGQPSETSRLDPLHGTAWAIWRFAIWKATGAVYRMDGGAVEDDPFIEPNQ
jgi:hypothetical protein